MLTPLLAIDTGRLEDWFRVHGPVVFWTVVVALIAVFVVRRTVPHAIRPAVTREMAGRPKEEVERRVDTLTNVVVRTANVIIFSLAVIMILPELGINIGPLIAGVSITSIAIGFGAQSLVRDTLNGLFILGENQFAQGDVVSIAGITGTVEDVSLRRTLLRDVDGVIHHVPNGAIVTSANYTRDYSKVRVTVPVAIATDLAKVRETADRVGEQLAADPEYRDLIVVAPKYLRVDHIDASGVAVQVNGTVKPGKQWEIGGVLRARLLEAFQQAGIKTPWG